MLCFLFLANEEPVPIFVPNYISFPEIFIGPFLYLKMILLQTALYSVIAEVPLS